MTNDLKLPAVGELTLPQWQDWLVRYNAVLTERDARIEKLEAALQDTLAYLDQYVDVVDGDNGAPEPNAAMSLTTRIEEVLK